MEDKLFVWSTELSKRLLQLRFENDWLFKKRKQPWREFYKILLESGFPQEMTVDQMRKKWSYLYDTYKIAKKEKNKGWQYYKLFEKHYGKSKVLDKYDSWNDEWRLKLITCIIEAKSLKIDYQNMWITIERAMRTQDLPEDCYIQDIKNLWHHIKMTFNRKHRIKLRQGREPDWLLYPTMLDYYQTFDPELLVKIETCTAGNPARQRKTSLNYGQNNNTNCDEEYEFQWTKDITESFIQIRLQNDWLFKCKKWAWNDLLALMVEEYGFPKMTGRELSRKWASTFSEYQKAKATNNKSWVYYTLFELYLGEGSLSLNPLVGWQEEWVANLISARIDLDYLFKFSHGERNTGWRDVEKRLRSIGLPLDHSLLELPEIWQHLLKTYRWKKKFSDKGILTEQWPYFEAMSHYAAQRAAEPGKHKHKHKQEPAPYHDTFDDDYEDDMKLFDLKQKLEIQVKPKFEYLEAKQCRSCSNEEGCVNIFEQKDDEGLNLAQKLKAVGDVQVEPTDSLPSQICLICLRELENAFKFRRKCQEVDKQFRNTNTSPHRIKVEVMVDEDHRDPNVNHAKHERDRTDVQELDAHFDDYHTDIHTDTEIKEKKPKIKKPLPKIPRKKKKVRKDKYLYYKVCDICGKNTRNLVGHLDTHATDKAYSCEVCDKKFKFKSGLIVHRAIHDPTPKKTCEICGKTFHILAQYRRHFVYHANERKYECETCGKRFNTIDILKVHNRMHTDERPFPCPDCGKTFRTAGCVSRHRRIVHRNVKSQ